jgi:tetratricopeptide (TPR) repeat protein
MPNISQNGMQSRPDRAAGAFRAFDSKMLWAIATCPNVGEVWMRKLLIGTLVALAALSASAQVTNQEKERCSGRAIPAASRVASCSQLIDSGRFPRGTLPMGYYYRGYAYLEQKLFKQAITDFDHAISLRPDFAQPHVFRGEAYFALGLYDKTIDDETKGIALRPNDDFALFMRGWAYEKKNMRERAIADYRAALKFQSGNQDARAGLARLGIVP